MNFKLSKRVVSFVIACALLSLIWFNAGSEGQLRKTYKSLSKQAVKTTASAVAALVSNKSSDVDVQMHTDTSPTAHNFSQAPFPKLPPPDVQEYMAICMAGKYLWTFINSRFGQVLSVCHSEEPIYRSS